MAGDVTARRPPSLPFWAATAFLCGLAVASAWSRPDLGTPAAWTRHGRGRGRRPAGIVHVVKGADGGLVESGHPAGDLGFGCGLCRPGD